MSPHFIDTSNRFDLLTDPTGSHRFLCVEVERMLQVQNAVFYRVCHAEDVFHSYFRVANPGEKSLGLTAARIFRELQQKNSAAMRSVNPMRFGQVLLKAGGASSHGVWKCVSSGKEVARLKYVSAVVMAAES